MKTVILATAFAAIFGGALSSSGNSEEVKLPKEVTPKLRAACESDVRRLCVDQDPTVAEVKSCVARKFLQLGVRCQFELASAGFRN
ncbi:MAG: hypothetical protein NW217_04435 [Hyphomicrobiaceae bacterium]|nr:hypothetical protein [Hyphomicrobiaceae bacterium]